MAFIIEERISLDASKITSIEAFCLASGNFEFSLRRLKTFSTSMMASSTITPIAIAIPPSVIVFMVISKNFSTNIDATRASGIAVNEIRVVLKFAKNKNRIIITRIAPSRNASITFSIARSIKSACLNKCVFMENPLGKLASISDNVSSILSVSSSVLAPGCF